MNSNESGGREDRSGAPVEPAESCPAELSQDLEDEFLSCAIDASLSRLETIWAAAGNAHAVFPIAYEQLVVLTRGEVTDLVESED